MLIVESLLLLEPSDENSFFLHVSSKKTFFIISKNAPSMMLFDKDSPNTATVGALGSPGENRQTWKI